jgi:hypothetical protein
MRVRDLLQPDAPCTHGLAARALGLAAAVNAFHLAPGRRTRPALDLPFFGATVGTVAAREPLGPAPLGPAPLCVLLRQRTLQSASHLALYAPALRRLLADPALQRLLADPTAPADPAALAAPAAPALERGRPPSARELRKLRKRAYDRAYSRAARAARAAPAAPAAREH